MRGKAVCRLHGGKGGGPKGERNGAYRTGRYTAEAKAERREVRMLTQRRHQPLFSVLHATGAPFAPSVALQLEVEAVGGDYVDLSEANENVARDQVHGVPAAILAETQGPIHCRCGEHDA